MNKRSSAPARVIAVAALAVAFVVVVAILASALGGDEDSGGSRAGGNAAKADKSQPRKVPATYEVKSGDTLISIANRLGVPVVRIERLNPEIDPQSLIVGEQLELR